MGKIVGVRFQQGGKVYNFDAGLFVLQPGDRVIVETEHGQALGEVVRGPRLTSLDEPETADQVEAEGAPPAPETAQDEAPDAGLDAASDAAPDDGAPEDSASEPEEQAAGEPDEDGADAEQTEDQQSEDEPDLKQVFRLATDKDLEQQEANRVLEKEAYLFCQERIAARRLDMNLVKVECMFDRGKILFYFTAEGRLDFRDLVRDLVGRYRTRVEMRQIGVRHEAKLLGGLGSCGREVCCATFLRDFEPVSVKMAKEQNLSLNPTKISGLCGRLMCCLTYEFETYKSLKKGLPKLGKRVRLSDGREAKVIRQNVLERKVTLLVRDEGEVTFAAEELLALLEPVGQQKIPPASQVAPPEPAPERAPSQPSEQPREQQAEPAAEAGQAQDQPGETGEAPEAGEQPEGDGGDRASGRRGRAEGGRPAGRTSRSRSRSKRSGRAPRTAAKEAKAGQEGQGKASPGKPDQAKNTQGKTAPGKTAAPSKGRRRRRKKGPDSK